MTVFYVFLGIMIEHATESLKPPETGHVAFVQVSGASVHGPFDPVDR